MIDEKKLIDTLKGWIKSWDMCENNYDSHRNKVLSDVIDRIEKLSLENKTSDKWIPCSDRLPEEEGVYLATFKNTFNQFVETVWFDSDGFFVKSKATVIAWMPLPEAYKGEE